MNKANGLIPSVRTLDVLIGISIKIPKMPDRMKQGLNSNINHEQTLEPNIVPNT